MGDSPGYAPLRVSLCRPPFSLCPASPALPPNPLHLTPYSSMISAYNNPYYFASSPTSASLDRTSGSTSAPHSASHSASSGKRASSERGASISSLGSSSDEENAREDEESPDIEDILSPPRSIGGASQASTGPGTRLTKPKSSAGVLERALARADRPPRIDDLFAELPSVGLPSMAPHNNKRRRICAEPNCCQKGLRGEASSKVAAAGAAASAVREQEVSKTFQDLFWKRQMWLMEHRDADGESHCSDDSADESEHEQLKGQKEDVDVESRETRRQGKKRSRSRHDDVLRTAGAGLPLARVKRAMKSADEEIKVSPRVGRAA